MDNQAYLLIALLSVLFLLGHMFDGCIDTAGDCRMMCNGTPVSYKPGSLNGVGHCICAESRLTDGGTP